MAAWLKQYWLFMYDDITAAILKCIKTGLLRLFNYCSEWNWNQLKLFMKINKKNLLEPQINTHVCVIRIKYEFEVKIKILHIKC